MSFLEVSALALAFAQWRRERGTDAEQASAADFRTWLQEVAFPDLLKRIDESTMAAIAYKSANTEHLQRIETLLTELHRVVLGHTDVERWATLDLIDRQVLQALFAKPDNTVVRMHSRDIAAELGIDLVDIRASADFLKAEGLLKIHEATGGLHVVSLTSDGALFAWSVLDPEGKKDLSQRLAARLRLSGGIRIGALSSELRAPPERVALLVSRWADEGLLELREYGGGVAHHLVGNVTESFRRRHNTSDQA